MSDYECPECGGGFPSADADGECPWCGEVMGGSGQSPPPNDNRRQVIPDDLGTGIVDLDEVLEGEGPAQPFVPGAPTIPPHKRRPVTPHWDSGIRIGVGGDTTTGESMLDTTTGDPR